MPPVAQAGPHLAAPVAPAPSPPVHLSDLNPLRALLTEAQTGLDDLLLIAGDATSEDPLWTPEAQRGDLARAGVELRRILLACSSEIRALSNLLRLAQNQRQRREGRRS